MPTINKPGRGRTQRREADDRNRADRSKIYNSAAWKRLRRAHLMGNPLCVSIHAPTEGATFETAVRYDKMMEFQSTLPRRERQTELVNL